MDLATCADELYGIDPAEFVARRTAMVKQAKADKQKELATEIGALRRPTVGAWYVNLAARSDLPSLSSLLHLGGRMRAAQATLDMAAVSSMTQNRRQLERQVLTELTAVLKSRGVTPSQAALDEVQHTLVAAVADPMAEAAVKSGCLARTLVYAGFGEVDLADALGAVLDRAPSSEPASTAPVSTSATSSDDAGDQPSADDDDDDDDDDEDEAEARAALAAAEKALAEAQARKRSKKIAGLTARLTAAHEAVERTRDQADTARQRLADAEKRLAQAEADAAEIAEALAAAEGEGD